MLALALSLTLAAAPRTAVMPLVGGDAISDRAAASLTDTLAVELQRQGGMEVVLPRLVATVLSPLVPRQQVGCTTDPCMAEFAGAFGAERLVTGEVSWDGGKLVLNLRLLEARSARVLSMSERGYKKGTLNDLLGGLPEMVPELLRAPAPAVAAKTAAAPKPVAASVEPAKASDPPKAAVRAPPGKFVLHYHRKDGRYRQAGLHSWETFETGSDLRKNPGALDVNWHPQTAAPDGIDGFGAYWMLPAQKFRNGRVNFAAAMGTSWDECGPTVTGTGAAKMWILADGSEAWMNVPECEVFGSAEEAQRNQRK
jgi:hypothetical protein